MAAFALGEAVGPRWPPAGAVVAGLGAALVFAPADARRASGWALVVAVAALAGSVVGVARLRAFDAFPARAWLGHAIRATAEVTGPPTPRPWGGWQAAARLRGRWNGARVELRARPGTPVPPAGVGALLAVRGGLHPLRPAEAYLRLRGIGATLDADAVRDTGAVRGGASGLVDGVRRRAQRVLTSGIPARESALLVGMVLGDASAIGKPDADNLRAAGLTHIVAASGANVALLALLVVGASALVGLPLRARLLGVLGAIALYVPLAGADPSIQRAGIMGAATVVAVLAGRPSARWHALLLAAAITQLANPHAAEDPGWQLSFVAVLALLLAASPLSRWLSRSRQPGRPASASPGAAGRLPRSSEPAPARWAAAVRQWRLPAPVADAVAVTVVATVATAPFIAWHFGRVSVVSLPANVVVAAAVAPAMWLGFAAGLVGQLAPGLAAVLTELAAVPVAFVLAVAHTAARAPLASVAATPAQVVAASVLLVGLPVGWIVVWRTRRRAVGRGRPVPAVAGLLVGAAVVTGLVWLLRPRPIDVPDAFQVAFLDVGQGDATLLRHGRSAILVDAGPPDGPVLARLDALGVRSLDVLVITHAQADHDGTAAAVLAAMPVRLLLDGRDGVSDPNGARAAAVARARHVRRVTPVAGTVVRTGPLVLRVLAPRARPTAARTAAGDPNDRAVVAVVQDGPTRVLLTADAESSVTAALPLPAVDVLKVAHHGSADPGLAAELARLRPRVAGIEVGADNPYGHPAPATLATLNGAVPVVTRADRDGTVVVTARGPQLTVRRHAG